MLSYGQLFWVAVPIDEYLQKGKSIVITRMKPVILTYLASEDKDRPRSTPPMSDDCKGNKHHHSNHHRVI